MAEPFFYIVIELKQLGAFFLGFYIVMGFKTHHNVQSEKIGPIFLGFYIVMVLKTITMSNPKKSRPYLF